MDTYALTSTVLPDLSKTRTIPGGGGSGEEPISLSFAVCRCVGDADLGTCVCARVQVCVFGVEVCTYVHQRECTLFAC